MNRKPGYPFIKKVGTTTIFALILFLFAIITGALFDELIFGNASIISDFIFSAGMLFIILHVILTYRINWRWLTGFRNAWKKHAREILLVVPLILFSLSMIWLTALFVGLLSEDLLAYLFADRMGEGPADPFWSVMDSIIFFTAVILAAPILEEYLFRGILLTRWKYKWNVTRAIMVTSFIFAILHLDFFGAFVFSVVTCLIYIKTGSLIIPIIIHMMNNLSALYYSYVLPSGFVKALSLDFTMFENVIAFTPYAAVFILVSVPFLGYWIMKNWPDKDFLLPYEVLHERYAPEAAPPDLPPKLPDQGNFKPLNRYCVDRSAGDAEYGNEMQPGNFRRITAEPMKKRW